MKKTNYFYSLLLLNLTVFLFVTPKLSYSRLTVSEIGIIVEDTVLGTLDCYATDIFLKAQARDHCNDQGLIWKYLIIELSTFDTIQYSGNYSPEPSEGIKGNPELDLLNNSYRAEIIINTPLVKGNYKVIWFLKDECWDEISKEQILTITDKTPPTPVLLKDFYPVGANGILEVKARALDKGGCGDGCLASFDNCTKKEGLYFTFTPMIPNLWVQANKWAQQFAQYGRNFFDPVTGAISTETKYLSGIAHAWYPQSRSSSILLGCDFFANNPPIPYLKVYLWDEFALSDDPGDKNYGVDSCKLHGEWECFGELTGQVLAYKSNYPVKDFTIHGSNSYGFFETKTDQFGNYSIEYQNSEFSVEAYKEKDDFLEGITTLDLVIIMKYLLGLKIITDPYCIIVADVNGSGSVTAADVLALRKIILGTNINNSIKSWIGIKKDYKWQNPSDPFQELDEAKKYFFSQYDFGNGDLRADFTGIKIGDMSCYPISYRNYKKFVIMSDDLFIRPNRRIEIPVSSKNACLINGMQLTFDLSVFTDFEIKSGLMDIGEKDYNITDNKFLLSYTNPNGLNLRENDVLFTLIVESAKVEKLSSLLRFAENSLTPEAYLGEELEIADLELEFRDNDFELYQNEPNPFSYKTSIGFNLTDQPDYKLSIYDLAGKTIYSVQSEGKMGYNKIELNAGIFSANGLYFYKIESGAHSVIKKMIYSF